MWGGYQQVSYEPMALGALGAQAMADGSNAVPHRQQTNTSTSTNTYTFCGQALLQRDPATGAPLFVHRVLAKYNLLNLVTTASWAWTTKATPRLVPPMPSITGNGDGDQKYLVERPTLEQHGWCLSYRDSISPSSLMARGVLLPAEPSLLELASHAIAARMEMAALF